MCVLCVVYCGVVSARRGGREGEGGHHDRGKARSRPNRFLLSHAFCHNHALTFYPQRKDRSLGTNAMPQDAARWVALVFCLLIGRIIIISTIAAAASSPHASLLPSCPLPQSTGHVHQHHHQQQQHLLLPFIHFFHHGHARQESECLIHAPLPSFSPHAPSNKALTPLFPHIPQTLKFRNYRPADASLVGPPTATLEEGCAAAAAKATEEPAAGRRKGAGRQQPGADQEEKRHEPDDQQPQQPHQKKEEEDAIQRELRRHEEEHGNGGQLNVAPRKPNWDLKRAVSKKVAKLNRLTQKAIVELLREKLAQEAEEESSSSSDSGSGSSGSEEESEDEDEEGKSDKE